MKSEHTPVRVNELCQLLLENVLCQLLLDNELHQLLLKVSHILKVVTNLCFYHIFSILFSRLPPILSKMAVQAIENLDLANPAILSALATKLLEQVGTGKNKKFYHDHARSLRLIKGDSNCHKNCRSHGVSNQLEEVSDSEWESHQEVGESERGEEEEKKERIHNVLLSYLNCTQP